MHFITAWDLKTEESRREEINSAMLEGLRGYSWVRLLSTFYIIEINFDRDWQVIHEKLLSTAQKYSGEINFLMSPIYNSDSDFFVLQMPDSDFYRT
jgi:hypothetical protein